MNRAARGFTMVELVMVIVLLGVLAIFVMPRMDTTSYRAQEFRDKTVAALRYAQKTATSHRRMVCVAFLASTVTLTVDGGKTGACGSQVLNLAGSNTNVVQSADTTNAVFSPVPAALYFQPDGRGTADAGGATVYSASMAISGVTAISVVGATGYVQ